MNKDIYIYGIIDIRDNSIIYVGKTTKPIIKRFKEHLSDKKNFEKYEYLKENKEYLEIVLLEKYINDNNINIYEKEQFYIDKHKPSIISEKKWFNKRNEIIIDAFNNTISILIYIDEHLNTQKSIYLKKIDAEIVKTFKDKIKKNINYNYNNYLSFYLLLKNVCSNRFNKKDIFYFTIAYIKLIQFNEINNNIKDIINEFFKIYSSLNNFKKYKNNSKFFEIIFPLNYN